MSAPCQLYVIELPEAARPKCRGGRGPCLYVGSTCKGLAMRFTEHRNGEGSRLTRTFGVKSLRLDLSPSECVANRAEAERAEKRLATSLRRRGYAVCQG